MESIEMKIAKTAAENWGQNEPQNLDEAKAITGGSEVSSIKGIISVLGLDPSLEVQLLDDIYNKETISPGIAEKIQFAMKDKADVFQSSDKLVIDMLSIIHDSWVKNNPNKFLQEGRNKEYQFAPLMLLNWPEAKSDLLFIKPILEAAGIELDEEALKDQFEVMQMEFLIDNGITSYGALASSLEQGSKFYPALEGLETKNGGNIEELLKQSGIVGKMARQIKDRIPIRTVKELAKYTIQSKNTQLDAKAWATSEVDDPNFSKDKFPRINGPISKREVLLSKLIGRPYPTYFLRGVHNIHRDGYRTTLESISGHELEEDGTKPTSTSTSKRKGVVRFGYNNTLEKRKKDGYIFISEEELVKAGLDPNEMGFESLEITGKDIAETDKSKGLTTTEVKNGGLRGFVKKLLDMIKGIGEK